MALVTEWKFEGNGIDSQGTQNASFAGTPSYKNMQSKLGWYAEDWSSGYCTTPYNAALNFNAGTSTTFSCSVLCKFTGKVGMYVCQTDDGRSPYGDGWRWRPFHGGSASLVTLNQGSNRGVGDLSGVEVGKLHHVCLTVDCASSNLAKIYLDGYDTGSPADYSTYNTNAAWDAGYYLGNGVLGTEVNRFMGTIYNLRLYSHALSSSEVLSISNALHKEYAQYRHLPVT